MTITSWSDYFTMSRPDNEKGNQNISIYTKAWGQNLSPATKLALLINNPNTIILAADTKGRILTLHSFTNMGGSLLRPANKIVCLIGYGQTAIAVIVDDSSTTRSCDIISPSHQDITACKSITELQQLKEPGEFAPITLEGTATFLPAPWLFDAITATGSSDPSPSSLRHWQRQNPLTKPPSTTQLSSSRHRPTSKILSCGHGESKRKS